MKTKVVNSFLISGFIFFCIMCRFGGNGTMNTFEGISLTIIAIICALILLRLRKVFVRFVRPFFRGIEYLLVNFLHTIFNRFSEVKK